MCGKEFSNVIALETHWIRHGIEVSHEAEEKPQNKTEKGAKASFSVTQLMVSCLVSIIINLSCHRHANDILFCIS